MRPQRCPQQGSRVSMSEALALIAIVVDWFARILHITEAFSRSVKLGPTVSTSSLIPVTQEAAGSSPVVPASFLVDTSARLQPSLHVV